MSHWFYKDARDKLNLFKCLSFQCSNVHSSRAHARLRTSKLQRASALMCLYPSDLTSIKPTVPSFQCPFPQVWVSQNLSLTTTNLTVIFSGIFLRPEWHPNLLPVLGSSQSCHLFLGADTFFIQRNDSRKH